METCFLLDRWWLGVTERYETSADVWSVGGLRRSGFPRRSCRVVEQWGRQGVRPCWRWGYWIFSQCRVVFPANRLQGSVTTVAVKEKSPAAALVRVVSAHPGGSWLVSWTCPILGMVME